MSSLPQDVMLDDIRAALTVAANLWSGQKAALDDFYEAFVWAQVVRLAGLAGCSVQFVNAGTTGTEFDFRRGPGRICSLKPYSYAEITIDSDVVELHIGIKVKGESQVSHELDILAIKKVDADICRLRGWDPYHSKVRFHAECKYHAADVDLGIARSIVGLLADCRRIHPMLVSRNDGPPNVRKLLKHHRATYVSNVFPGDTGMPYLETCINAAFRF